MSAMINITSREVEPTCLRSRTEPTTETPTFRHGAPSPALGGAPADRDQSRPASATPCATLAT
eukprot:2436544-Prymnesium_polylepis.1